MSVRVRVASFTKGFPKDMPAPERLLAFAEWVKKVQRGALGWFDAIESEPLDVTYTDNEAATKALRTALGIFLSLPDGSRLALWNHGGASAVPAVVLLGSEGGLRNVAPDLDTFLVAWAEGRSGVAELDEDDAEGEVASMRPALATWLAAAGARRSKARTPSFKAWFDNVVKENTSAEQLAEEARATEKALASAEPVTIDLPSLLQGVPAGAAMPPRLERFAGWLGKTRQGGLTESDVGLRGFPHSLVNDDRVDAELRKSLAFFLRARDIVNNDEVALALWFHAAKKAPVVVVRAGDDEWRSVAIDLDTFLFAWSRGTTGVDELDDGGVAKVRAELGAWLAREGATDRGAKAKAPDVRAWIKTVRAAAAAAATKKRAAAGKTGSAAASGKPGKPRADMAERVPALLGKPKDDPVVVAFCAELGIDIENTNADDVLNRYFVPEHGYSLGFRVPVGEDRTRRFLGARFHQAKHRWWSYARGRDVSFAAFKGPLPRGVSFTWSRDEVLEALGTPTTTKDSSLEWTDPTTQVRLGVEFAGEWDKIPAGQITCVWLAL